LISYHNPSREGELSIMKNIQQYKIDILSQSVLRRRALNHEKYPTIQNWYLITIRPTKASSQSWKISNNTKVIFCVKMYVCISEYHVVIFIFVVILFIIMSLWLFLSP